MLRLELNPGGFSQEHQFISSLQLQVKASDQTALDRLLQNEVPGPLKTSGLPTCTLIFGMDFTHPNLPRCQSQWAAHLPCVLSGLHKNNFCDADGSPGLI